jgi:hypothetical protein
MSAREDALRKRAELLRNQLTAGQQKEQRQPFFRIRQAPEAVGEGGLPGGVTPSTTPFDRAATIPEDVTREPVGQIARRAGEATVENLDIPGGMAGAVAGAKAGAPLGPYGIAGGLVVGGALGTFGGSIATDALTEEDVSFAQATEEALLSAGIDTATLGSGKVLKPAYFALRRKLGFDPNDAAQEILNRFTASGEGGRAGSEESIARTQQMFSESGTSLTPFQTGRATAAQNLGDRIARVGIFSEPIIQRNIGEQSRVINERMESLFSDAVSSPDRVGPEAIGDIVFSTIQQGKLALQDSYVRGLNEISERFGRASVRTEPILREARQFLEDKSFAGGASTELDSASLSVVRDFIDELESAPASLTVDDLFKYEKNLQSQINQLSDARSSGFNSRASAELAELSSRIRERTLNIFEGINPDLRQRFSALKSEYSQGLNELIPDINKNMINNASSKGMFSSIGSTLTSTGKPEQINAFYNSINRAFAEAKREGRDLPFESADEIKDIVRQGFVAKTLPKLGPDFDLREYRRLSTYFETPANQEKAKAVLGEKYEPFKQLVNAMSEASVRPDSNIGELMIRSKEFTALSGITQAGAGFAVGGLGGAVALLASPIFLAKAATNPKNVNRIVAFDKRKFGSENALETAAVNTMVDIFNELSEEDQTEIKRSLIQTEENMPVMMGEE